MEDPSHPHHPLPHRYTYGKPVQGKVHATLCQPWSFRMYPYLLEENKDICTEVGGQVSKAGSMGETGKVHCSADECG